MEEEISPKETTKEELMPKRTDYTNVSLFNADFSYKKLRGYDFSFSTLKLANFEGSDLSHARFIRADLYRANFRNTVLYDTVFRDANLTRADFRGARLYGIRLIGADLTRTKFDRIITEEKEARSPEDFSRAAEVYSILRRAYRESHQLSISGYYYYREMYCRTRSDKNTLRRLLKIVTLEKMFGYGEKIFNPIFFALLIIVLFSVLYYISPISFGKSNSLIKLEGEQGSRICSYLDSLLYSIGVFFLIQVPHVAPRGICTLFSILETILGFITNSVIVAILIRKIIRD